jgi:hypothetical protein
MEMNVRTMRREAVPISEDAGTNCTIEREAVSMYGNAHMYYRKRGVL